MLAMEQQKSFPAVLAILLVIVAAAGVCIAAPDLSPWLFLGLAAAVVIGYWAVRWDVTIWAWLWVLSYGLLDWLKVDIGDNFKMSVPRFIVLAAALAFALQTFLRRGQLQTDGPMAALMIALTILCAASASITGWTAHHPQFSSSPYFRFFSGILFPFLIFGMVYASVRQPRQLRWGLLLLTAYGWYAIYIGYLQYAALTGHESARHFIWPAYINDPTYGIHFERARGAFDAAGPQGILMVSLFYVDLFLFRRLRGWYRWAVLAQAVLAVGALFFTGMRSAFLGFGIGGVIWCLWGSGRWRFGWLKLSAAGVILAVAAMAFWGSLTQENRLKGGLTERGPIHARYLLAVQTMEIFERHPIFGAGFGHFVDEAHGSSEVEHNLLLNMLAETGLVGLAVTVTLIVLVFRRSRQLYRKLPATAAGILCPDVVVLFWIVLANFLTDAMFRDTLWDAFATGLLWTFAAYIAAFNRLLDNR